MSALTVIKFSQAFKEHIAAYAAERNKSLSDVVREAVAGATGYNLADDAEASSRGRPFRYASEEARKEAARERRQAKVEHDRKVVAALMKSQRLEGADALERWLRVRGIAIDE